MKLESTPPFSNYVAYKNFHKKEGRWQVCLVPMDGSTSRRTITYAKYLMCIHLNRIIAPEEQVDHINNDKADDRIENLQILSKKDNSAKSHPKKFVELLCLNCRKYFNRANRNRPEMKGISHAFCSRRCKGLYEGFTTDTM
jgi:hypothetical protein